MAETQAPYDVGTKAPDAEVRYTIADGAHLREQDAAIVGPALARLAQSGEGDGFRAEDVVDAARPTSAPLHPYFEWRNDVAAELFRLEQARGLVRSITVTVVVRDEPIPLVAQVRQYHHVRVQTQPGEPLASRYVPVQLVQESEDYTAQVVRTAARELRGWSERYATYRHLRQFQAFFAEVFDQIDAVTAASE